MKIPQYAFLMLDRNCKYPVETINFETKLVTLKESTKVYNTVSIKNVRFDYTGFNKAEKEFFQMLIN